MSLVKMVIINTVESRHQGTEPVANVPRPGRMPSAVLCMAFRWTFTKKIRTVSFKPEEKWKECGEAA